jgi:protocatechuate 3,4-dioxygenase beta subunit
MVRSAYVLAALLIPGAAVAQTTTTTTQGPDGRPYTVTTTRSPDGLNQIEARPAPPGGAPVPDTVPPRDTRAATGTSVIRGRVVDATSGTPLRKAMVRVFGAGIRESRTAVTDADGRYEFTDLPAGQFNVNANKVGYLDVGFGQSAPFELGKPLKLGDKQVLEKIDFALPHGAVITGRVLDEYGEPVADVQVSALRKQYTGNGPRPTMAGRPGSTNDIGEFRLFGLPPGQYMISASLRAFAGQVTTGDSAGYALTYYPGTASVAEAQTLAVGRGGTISDVTLMLVATRTARLSGTVFDGEGRPMKQGAIMLINRSGPMGSMSMGGGIRPDGSFTISGVAPGEYTLRGNVPGPAQPGLPLPVATADVTVNGVDISDIRVEPSNPITLSGRVLLDPVAARSFKPETVRLTATAIEPGPMFGPPPPPAAVHDDLTFAFTAVVGPSVIRATAPGWMVKSVTLNGADVTDGFTIRNDDVSDLVVELTNQIPEVSGLVTDGGGAPVSDYFAVVFPQEQERWTAPGPNRTAMARADDQGRFRIRTLRPGNYYVVAVDHVQTGEWMDPAFMEAVHTHARRITVNEGDVQTLDLKLVQIR